MSNPSAPPTMRAGLRIDAGHGSMQETRSALIAEIAPPSVTILRPTIILSQALWLGLTLGAVATPANKAALERYYGPFLNKDLARCTTCHLPSPNQDPQSLEEFPHNPFGDRLRALGEELEKQGRPHTIAVRLEAVAKEDSDGDGVANELEILGNGNPGDGKQAPSPEALAAAPVEELARFLASYRWRPFDPVVRPPVPDVKPSRLGAHADRLLYRCRTRAPGSASASGSTQSDSPAARLS